MQMGQGGSKRKSFQAQLLTLPWDNDLSEVSDAYCSPSHPEIFILMPLKKPTLVALLLVLLEKKSCYSLCIGIFKEAQNRCLPISCVYSC